MHLARSSDGEEVAFFWISSTGSEKSQLYQTVWLVDQAVAQFFTSQIE